MASCFEVMAGMEQEEEGPDPWNLLQGVARSVLSLSWGWGIPSAFFPSYSWLLLWAAPSVLCSPQAGRGGLGPFGMRATTSRADGGEIRTMNLSRVGRQD